VCKLLKINKVQITAYHPEGNGALERSHRTLTEYLRHYINADQTDWDEWLPYVIFTYNTHTAYCILQRDIHRSSLCMDIKLLYPQPYPTLRNHHIGTMTMHKNYVKDCEQTELLEKT